MAGEAGNIEGFHPFDVQATHLAYAILGGFVVLFGMFSLLIKEKLYVGEAPLATIFGIIIGPYAIGLFNPRSWGGASPTTTDAITLEVTRVVLAIGVFAIGVELPKQYMLKHWKSLFFMLVPLMTYGWFVSAALIYALVPGLSFLSAMVIGACLTPTDPILAAAVVGGKYANKHVPAHLRHLLAAESACNDGAAFPFLYIGLYLTLDSSDGHAVGQWFYITWLYEVTLGIVFGAVLGFCFRHLMKFCERKNLIDRHSYVAQYISLAMLAIGATTLLGSDDLLAAFSCGTAFAWDGWFNRQTEESQFSNVIDLLFNCACFIYIGAWIPFNDFNSSVLTLNPWRLTIIGVLILLLRRLPAVIALYRWIPDVKTFREALFSGHFGPMGVGAIFISTLASTKLPAAHDSPTSQVELLASTVQPVVAFVVLCSIATHGLSIPFFSLGRRVHSITFTYTWSRRQSMDPAAPEWATQVRRMPSRREDIVINRDEKDQTPASSEDRMEKGLPERIGSEDGTPTAHASASGESGTPTPANEMASEDIADAQVTEEDRDGNRQWREGRDLVVETQIDPTEEVQVRVVKDAFKDEHGNMAEGMADEIRTQVEASKTEVRREAKSLSERLENSQAGPSRLSNVLATRHANKVVDLDESPTISRISKSEGPSRRSTTGEEEWKDEPLTEADQEGSGTTVVFEEPVKPPRHDRSVSPKKRKHIFTGSRRGKRRDSVRRALFSTGIKSKSGSPNDSGDEGVSSADHSAASSPAGSTADLSETLRGRNPEASGQVAMPPSRRSSMRPATRVGSRTASPAPSRIRFADDPDHVPSPSSPGTDIARSHSGLIHGTTPQHGVYSPSSSGPIAHEAGGSESNRVMFDLPAKPERS